MLRWAVIFLNHRDCRGGFRLCRDHGGRREHREAAVLHFPDSVRHFVDCWSSSTGIRMELFAFEGPTEALAFRNRRDQTTGVPAGH